MSHEIVCYHCHAELTLEPGQHIPRNEECPKCYANIHSCLMCTFYDSSSYNECREPMANRILEKEKANFCEFFKLKTANDNSSAQDDLMSKANALFKD